MPPAGGNRGTNDQADAVLFGAASEAAHALDAAVAAVYAAGRWLTPDQGGAASTTEFCSAVTDMIRI